MLALLNDPTIRQLVVGTVAALLLLVFKSVRTWLHTMGASLWHAYRSRTAKAQIEKLIVTCNGLATTLAVIGATLEEVRHQVFPNQGGALPDQIQRNHTIALAVATAGTKDGCFTCNEQGNVDFVNSVLELWTNKDRRELAGRGLGSTIRVADQHEFRQAWDYSIATGNDFRGDFHMRFVDRDTGEYRHVKTEWFMEPVQNTAGATIAWAGHVRRSHPTGQQDAVRGAAPPMGALAFTDPS